MIFLTTLCLIGYCFAFTRCTRWSIETTPFFVISILISLLYGFAYFGYLHLGAVILLALGASSLFLAPFYVTYNQLYSRYLTPGFTILFLFSALFAVVASHSHLYLWDEFTQWGAHAKFISVTHGFWTKSNEVIYPGYPPGAALFYYLFYPFSSYSEGAAYYAQQILILLPLGILLKDIAWRKWPRAFLSLAFASLILMFLHVHMGTKINLYLDGVVGIYFGMCLLHSRESKNSFWNVFYYIPILFAFMLLKIKLFGFALFITAFILVGGVTKATLSGYSKRMLGVLLLLATLLVAHWSWEHYIRFMPFANEKSLRASFSQVVKILLTLDFTPLQERIALNFAYASVKLLPVVAIIFALAFCTVRLLKDKLLRRRVVIDQFFLLLGFFGFLAGLLLMYMFAFSSYEAVRLASFSRYTKIYLIGWALFTYGRFLPALFSVSFAWKRKLSTTLTGILLLGLPVFLMTSHAARVRKDRDIQSLWNTQRVIKRVAKSVSAFVPENAKVFTVWQASTGLERAILMYELIPRKLNINATSFGKRYFSGDVWTSDISADKFAQEISSYDYLLLAYTDQNFWQHYGSLFPEGVNEHPFAEYLICRTSKFNGFREPGCKMQSASVYLFRIKKKGNKVLLRAV